MSVPGRFLYTHHRVIQIRCSAYLEFVNKRQEKVSLQASFIEGVWNPVGSADKDQAVLPEPRKEPVQDGSICHIVHKELIQTQHFAFPCYCICDLYQRVLLGTMNVVNLTSQDSKHMTRTVPVSKIVNPARAPLICCNCSQSVQQAVSIAYKLETVYAV